MRTYTAKFAPGDKVYIDGDRKNRYTVLAMMVRADENGMPYIAPYQVSWLCDGEKTANIEGYRMELVPEDAVRP